MWFIGGQSLANDVTFLLFNIQCFGEDLHVCSSPWFLILMSTALREELRKTFGIVFWKQKTPVGVIVRVSSATRTQ